MSISSKVFREGGIIALFNLQKENFHSLIICFSTMHHLNRLCVVVNVHDPHPLVVQVLRLLREDHVGPAVAQLLLVDVEDPCLDLVLEQKKEFEFEFRLIEILCKLQEVPITCHAKQWKLVKSALLEKSRDGKM